MDIKRNGNEPLTSFGLRSNVWVINNTVVEAICNASGLLQQLATMFILLYILSMLTCELYIRSKIKLLGILKEVCCTEALGAKYELCTTPSFCTLLLINSHCFVLSCQQLKKIRSLLLAGAAEYDNFFQHLRLLDGAFKLSAKDLRSQVVREACITLG